MGLFALAPLVAGFFKKKSSSIGRIGKRLKSRRASKGGSKASKFLSKFKRKKPVNKPQNEQDTTEQPEYKTMPEVVVRGTIPSQDNEQQKDNFWSTLGKGLEAFSQSKKSGEPIIDFDKAFKLPTIRTQVDLEQDTKKTSKIGIVAIGLAAVALVGIMIKMFTGNKNSK